VLRGGEPAQAAVRVLVRGDDQGLAPAHRTSPGLMAADERLDQLGPLER
jgi:hypothetical protein